MSHFLPKEMKNERVSALTKDDKNWAGWKNTSSGILAALDAAGYAIVRREPDEAMIDAAFGAIGSGANELEAERAQYRHAYQLMIAAQEQKP